MIKSKLSFARIKQKGFPNMLLELLLLLTDTDLESFLGFVFVLRNIDYYVF